MTTKKKKPSPSSPNHSPTSQHPAKKVKFKDAKDNEKGKSERFLVWRKHGLGYAVTVVILACTFGFLNSWHVSRMFENERFFSHLSALERELSFRTEMGLYYSYYKTMVEAPTFLDGLHAVMNCNVTEYPDTVNTLKRFNLYPEVILAGKFRIFEWLASKFEYQTKTCYTVNRGYGLPPVQSCEGLGELSFFYVYSIFFLTGLMMACFFILCFYLSGSILGGVLGTLCYFFNHGEATRVMWTPPLRESFSYPYLVAQLLVVTFTLRSVKVTWRHITLVSMTTALFMIPWQFAQFALLTQTCALFVVYIMHFITADKFCKILYGLLVAHLLNFAVQFGNSMLLSSFFMSAVISALVVAKAESQIHKLPYQLLIWATQGLGFAAGTLGIKVAVAKVLSIADDSKFTSYRDFHTLLYTCAPEFDFLDQEAPVKLTKTLLLPSAIVAASAVIAKVGASEWEYWVRGKKSQVKSDSADEHDEGAQGQEANPRPHAEYVYHVLQAMAFVLMAVIIMRLKLFGTPALCVLASLVASRQFFSFLGDRRRHQAIVIALIAVMSVQGFSNLKTQFNTTGEYNNPEMEELVEFITTRTQKDAVFAGAMPTMATVKLSTGRAVVNHPHYEDVGIRERTHKVYQIFSRKPPHVVWNTLDSMGVTHVIIDAQWCMGRPKPGCGMSDMWDLEDEKNRHRSMCCSQLEVDSKPFVKVFKNKKYSIYKLHRERS
ncbi:predicted protein [Nematostella vectensis]|uniref:C-mannosyltransferase DPY19L1 n=1 Tax=Nematostella vectensis TaxID=45351 RepID=A7ST13_NEMVE|nr:predicted protein [Nematostella vectensis]|eukprot:XP_001625259.1 predicted protein [Nematostella vectensis]